MPSTTLPWLRCAFVSLFTAGTVLDPTAALAAPARPALAPVPGTPAGAVVAAQVRSEIAARGTATFLVRLSGDADLAPATRARGKGRAARVFTAKTSQAEHSQAGLRGMLRDRAARFTPYWIVNAIRVTGDAALLDAVAARPEVREVLPDRKLPLPEALPGRAHPAVALPVAGSGSAPRAAPGTTAVASEWNVDRTGSPRVWTGLGVRGEGVVVANIDTGVQADHPALAASYRGNGVGHDHNWFDPAHVCPTAAPCDNVGHGTHTMGTMVGAGDPAVGLAPGAKWIAAKGCESSFCTTSSLLAAGQWMVAPTDSSGANPRPDLAPDVVNNSWGGDGLDPWYEDVVRAWVAAGIFPAFSAGNSGPRCASVGNPGGYDASYATGATGPDDVIAPFSSRGAVAGDGRKPDIVAPGVDVRSTVPDGYDVYSGTSMASPHTAGTVALLWSAAPALRGDIAATRQILDGTAADTDDTSCGGTADQNNVYGQGLLDTYGAVASVLTGSGSLSGAVTSGEPADTGEAAVPGATVTIDGPVHRRLTAGGDGGYRAARVPVGSYTVAVEAFGFRKATVTAQVGAGGDVRADVTMARLPHAVVSGTVTTGRGAAVPATVALSGTPVSVRTDASGGYRMDVPLGGYELRVQPVGGCAAPAARPVTVERATVLHLALEQRVDGYGYTCGPPSAAYRSGDSPLGLIGDDMTAEVTLPFPARFYGVSYDRAWISTNGLISFAGPAPAYANGPLPAAADPNAALYPFWDDLVVDDQAAIYVGESPDGYVVEWRNMAIFGASDQRISFSATIGRDGAVTFAYRGSTAGSRAAGGSATIGVEGPDGAAGLAYSVDGTVVSDGSGVTFHPPENARHG